MAVVANDVLPELSPAINRAKIAERFRAVGRVHIPDVLTRRSAERLYRCLTHETKWSVTLNNGQDFLDFDNISLEERMKLALQAWQRAQNSFQYLFDNHRLTRKGEPYPDASHYYARVVDFLNSPDVLGFVREITGLSDIAWADAQATLYRPGDFLTVHDDETGGYKRLVAYVLNLTPVWRPDWGGALNFLGPTGHIEEAFVPTFNALNIFRVPARHFVGTVAPFGGLRTSVTGWFHGR
jgi:Rps23 Pro-64 3,4-dihydroxylase Tpa1-like proline 4-hydroxylase